MVVVQKKFSFKACESLGSKQLFKLTEQNQQDKIVVISNKLHNAKHHESMQSLYLLRDCWLACYIIIL